MTVFLVVTIAVIGIEILLTRYENKKWDKERGNKQ